MIKVKNVSRKTYLIALRELSLITSHCDGERSRRPFPEEQTRESGGNRAYLAPCWPKRSGQEIQGLMFRRQRNSSTTPHTSNANWLGRRREAWRQGRITLSCYNGCASRASFSLVSRIERGYKFCKFYYFSLVSNLTIFAIFRLTSLSRRFFGTLWRNLQLYGNCPASARLHILQNYDFSLTLRLFNKSLRNLRLFAINDDKHVSVLSGTIKRDENMPFNRTNV